MTRFRVTILGTAVLFGSLLGGLVAQTNHELPACVYEDGNPDGLPCIWTSNEGIEYYNDGSNYRD